MRKLNARLRPQRQSSLQNGFYSRRLRSHLLSQHFISRHTYPCWACFKPKKKRAPAPGCDSTPILPPVALDYLLAYGQTNACTRVLVLGMQTPEYDEDFFQMRSVDANPVVLN